MRVFNADPPQPPPGPGPTCDCFVSAGKRGQRVPSFHDDVQDTSCDAWLTIVDRIDTAVREASSELALLDGLSGADRARIVTLPASIGRLASVRHLELYGSHLIRIPPEIGAMRSLESIDIYTSYRLHFLPFEVTRCVSLKDSRMSTRVLFGNYRNRGYFPDLLAAKNAPALAASRPQACSVCAARLEVAAVLDRWTTLPVGTDVVPLLASVCSQACADRLPEPAAGYVSEAHTGGRRLQQPPPRF